MEAESCGVAKTATLIPRGNVTGSRAYLLVIEGNSSRMFPMLTPSVVTVGRSPDVDLHLDHPSVSRRHARLLVGRGEVRISDLDSHNGTRVNNEVLQGARVLIAGDIVMVGEVILVLHAELYRDAPPVTLDAASWRRRLGEEVERAVSFGRSLGVLAISNGEFDIASLVRKIDVIGADENGKLLALLPEADGDTAVESPAAWPARCAGSSPRAGSASRCVRPTRPIPTAWSSPRARRRAPPRRGRSVARLT
jgi:two-component system response regulator AtoC